MDKTSHNKRNLNEESNLESKVKQPIIWNEGSSYYIKPDRDVHVHMYGYSPDELGMKSSIVHASSAEIHKQA